MSLKILSLTSILCLLLQMGYASLHVCADCPYQAIKPAIAAAQAGDTIFIHEGLYQEGNILINKALTIIGIGYPVIDGQNETEVITVTANRVTLQGLHIKNVGVSYLEDRAGIRIQKAKHFLIKDNKLTDTFFGIYLEHAREGKVLNNVFKAQAREESSSGNAVHAWYCRKLLVKDNYMSGHRDGIYFEFVDSSIVRNNLSENHLRYGLHFMFSNNDSYEQNTFRNNGAGVAVMFSKKINMWENHFVHNWGGAAYGLLLKEINDGDIVRNVFEENTIGIYVEGANRIHYLNNVFKHNGWAIKIAGGCMDNDVSGNNFISNTFDLAQAGKGTYNRFDGNYWSEYTGYDLDRDGIGDVPFRPVKLFSYVVDQTPETMVLLRSTFVDLINFSEKISPILTPAQVQDHAPHMQEIKIPFTN